MSNRSLEQILVELRNVSKVANQPPELLLPATRAAHEMAIQHAKERLEVVQDEYKARLLANASVYYVEGDPTAVQTFLDEAIQLGQHVFVLSPATVYNELATRVEETMGGSREFSGNQLAALIYAQKELARKEGLPNPLVPDLTELRYCATYEDTLVYVRDLIRQSSGDQTAYVYLRNQLGNQALARDCVANEVIVLLTGVTPEEQEGFAPYFPGAKALDPEVDRSFVIKVVEQQEAPKKPQRTKKQHTQEQ